MNACPFCGAQVEPVILPFDDEDVEGWSCTECDAATMGDHADGMPEGDGWDWPPETKP